MQTYVIQCAVDPSGASRLVDVTFPDGTHTYERRELIEHMIPIEAHSEYGILAAKKRGRDEAEAVYARLVKLPDSAVPKIFGSDYYVTALDVIRALTLTEIERVLDEHDRAEREANTIHRGDEVRCFDRYMFATTDEEDGYFDGVDNDGVAYQHRSVLDWKKTGRHSEEIERLFGKRWR